MLHRIDNLQDGWVVEVRRRLSGKAAGQIYKLWISPRGEQIWTKTLGLKINNMDRSFINPGVSLIWKTP